MEVPREERRGDRADAAERVGRHVQSNAAHVVAAAPPPTPPTPADGGVELSELGGGGVPPQAHGRAPPPV